MRLTWLIVDILYDNSTRVNRQKSFKISQKNHVLYKQNFPIW